MEVELISEHRRQTRTTVHFIATVMNSYVNV